MTKPVTYAPFGPKICGWKMPEELVFALNEDCELVTQPKQLSDYDYSYELIGQIELQAKFSNKILEVWDTWFIDRVNEYLEVLGAKPMNTTFQDHWYNRTLNTKEYNPEHIHPNALITSVGYLKLPSNHKEELTKPQKNGEGGGLELHFGETANFCTTSMTIIPSVGDFFIFPSMLRHCVYPMPKTITEERRSFSINFGTANE